MAKETGKLFGEISHEQSLRCRKICQLYYVILRENYEIKTSGKGKPEKTKIVLPNKHMCPVLVEEQVQEISADEANHLFLDQMPGGCPRFD